MTSVKLQTKEEHHSQVMIDQRREVRDYMLKLMQEKPAEAFSKYMAAYDLIHLLGNKLAKATNGAIRISIESYGDTLDEQDLIEIIGGSITTSIAPQEHPRRSATRAQEHMCNIREHREKIKALEVLIEQEENAAFALMGNIVRH